VSVKFTLKKNGGDLQELSKRFKISETTAQVLLNRDVRTFADAQQFLYPSLSSLAPVDQMAGVAEAYAIIKEGLLKKDRIVVYGDYDADGVMSVAILVKALTALNADCSYYIPKRGEEGYGLNNEAVVKLKEYECDLLITCDNGISAMYEIGQAKALGMKTIVIDHHEPGFMEDGGKRIDVLPDADAVIDPNMRGCTYPFKRMCAAGLCYRFTAGLFEYLNKPNPDADEALAFACVATFCDIVDLRGENRVLAKNGLKLINDGIGNKGLDALIKEKNLAGRTIGDFEIGFILGPCVNAAGRLEDAEQAAAMFLTDDSNEAESIARRLNDLNEERKKMTAESYERIMDALPYPPDPVLVIYDETTHESIAGIVAGRIKDKTRRPAIVFTGGGELVKGSARSTESYNIFEELYKNRELFARFGGHAMAAGITIETRNIEKLRDALNEACALTEDDFEEAVKLDGILSLPQITYELAVELKLLEPYGKDNREPLFGSKNVAVTGIKFYDEKNTLIFYFSEDNETNKTPRTIKGVCFGKTDEFKSMLNERYDGYELAKIMAGVLRAADLRLDIIYNIGINEYNGNVSVELKVRDFRFPG